MKRSKVLVFSTFLLFSTTAFSQELTHKWTSLLTPDGRNFDVFMGIPHESLASLPGWDKGDGMNTGTPLGLNNDPLHVFTIEKEGDMGDMYFLVGVGSDVHARLKDSTNNKSGWIYDPTAGPGRREHPYSTC